MRIFGWKLILFNWKLNYIKLFIVNSSFSLKIQLLCLKLNETTYIFSFWVGFSSVGGLRLTARLRLRFGSVIGLAPWCTMYYSCHTLLTNRRNALPLHFCKTCKFHRSQGSSSFLPTITQFWSTNQTSLTSQNFPLELLAEHLRGATTKNHHGSYLRNLVASTTLRPLPVTVRNLSSLFLPVIRNFVSPLYIYPCSTNIKKIF